VSNIRLPGTVFSNAPIGPLQLFLMKRAGRSRVGAVSPADGAERKALRRLEARSLVRRAGLLDLWHLTDAGRGVLKGELDRARKGF